MQLIHFTKEGLYVPQADVYIDPWKRVKKAFITHGHADHSRYGNKAYVASQSAVPVIKHRLGSRINITGIPYGETMMVNGVKFSFHPAGHIIGSAQIRVEYKGHIWVASGDYKIENDGISEAFEPVKCHAFITESTFGLPVFKWRPQKKVITEINEWWQANKEAGKVSILASYSLGKAQRLIHSLDSSIGKIFTHGAVENVNEVIRKQGIHLPVTHRVVQKQKPKEYRGALVIAPPGSSTSSWASRFNEISIGAASGWMATRGTRRWGSADRSFVLSDHADWDGLLNAVKWSGAEKIYVTHGYAKVFSNYLKEIGYYSAEVDTEYTGEQDEMPVNKDGETP